MSQLDGAAVRKIVVATDRSVGGDRAAQWAARLAAAHDAQLTLVRVIATQHDADELRSVEDDVSRYGAAFGASTRVIAADDVAAAIVGAAREQGADVLVVGNSGMRGRKELLLGNVANRVTHSSPCTTIVVQSTELGDEEEVVVSADGDPQRIARAVQILRVFGRIGLRRVLVDRGTGEQARTDAQHLREALEELGPVFCKLGQILSTRPDLLPPEFIDELAALRTDVPPLTEAEVVSVMEQELLVPWEDVFAWLDPAPLAAGTIGQVHRAMLSDGTRVVVKVQRPAAAGIIHRDLALLRSVVRGAGVGRRLTTIVDLPTMVEDLADSLITELDFHREAVHLERMGVLLAGYERLGVPRCHPDLSTGRLLVMDEVPGVPVDEAPPGPEREAAARELLAAFFEQVLSAGFFHADPHPGNLLWADGKIWLLDLGMVGEVDESTRRQLLLLLLAFWQEDTAFLADLTLGLAAGSGRGGRGVDVAEFERDLGELVASVHGVSLAEIELGPLLQQLTTIALRHRVPIPGSLAMVGKSLSQVQLTVTTLAPDIDLFDEARRFFTRDLVRRLSGGSDPTRLLYEAEKLGHRVMMISDVIATATGARPGRRLEVGFSSDQLERTIARTGRLVAAGLVAGFAILGVGVVAAAPGGVSLRTFPSRRRARTAR